MHEQAKATAPHAGAIVASAEGRRRATRLITTNFEHIPPDLLAHQLLGVAGCTGALPMIEHALREGYAELDARADRRARCASSGAPRTGSCPGRRPPRAIATSWLPHADWVELDGVGHCPPLDVPLEAAQLILGFVAQAS